MIDARCAACRGRYAGSRAAWISDLKGRTALVTGASSGLGLATAEALAGEGANVSMFARRRDVLEREADRIGALAVRGDVTIPKDLERAVATTVEAFGGLDILVWNSGGPPPGPAIDVTPESLEQALELDPRAGRSPRATSACRTSSRAPAAASSRSRRSRRRSRRGISRSRTRSARPRTAG